MAYSAAVPAAFTVLDLPGDRTLIGLARVSTDAQDAQLQHDALAAAGCGRVYTEKISTRKAAAERPGLTAALGYVRQGDTLTVWKLDRLGRSVKEVLTIADDLHARGVGVRILTGKLSGAYSPTGEGKFFFTMMAAFAELERDIIHERTMAGLVAARAQGRTGGRPTVMDADKLAAAKARRERGESPTQIAKALGISRASVYRHLAADGPGRLARPVPRFSPRHFQLADLSVARRCRGSGVQARVKITEAPGQLTLAYSQHLDVRGDCPLEVPHTQGPAVGDDVVGRDLGPGYYEQRAGTRRQVRSHVRSLERYGYKVTIEPLDPGTDPETGEAITKAS